jgi:hypothetical protein
MPWAWPGRRCGCASACASQTQTQHPAGTPCACGTVKRWLVIGKEIVPHSTVQVTCQQGSQSESGRQEGTLSVHALISVPNKVVDTIKHVGLGVCWFLNTVCKPAEAAWQAGRHVLCAPHLVSRCSASGTLHAGASSCPCLLPHTSRTHTLAQSSVGRTRPACTDRHRDTTHTCCWCDERSAAHVFTAAVTAVSQPGHERPHIKGHNTWGCCDFQPLSDHSHWHSARSSKFETLKSDTHRDGSS